MIFHETDKGITFQVKIIPRAHRDEIVGVENDALKIRVHAPPVEGRANEALLKFLAQKLNLARVNIEIVRGATSQHKIVRVRGMSRERLEEILLK